MKITNVELKTVCGITSDLPSHETIEVAFWGRSNVGKSSLLNRLWGRKGLARTSSEPGKTQTINYYLADIKTEEETKQLYMVDLPGYGYAKTSRENTKKWMSMITRYLEKSQTLVMVCLLIDSRRPPSELDLEQFRLLYSLGFNPLIVATKTDKLKKNEKRKNIKLIEDSINKETEEIEIPVVPFSATTGDGADELKEYLCQILK